MPETMPAIMGRTIRDEVSVFSAVILNAVTEARLERDGYTAPLLTAGDLHAGCRYVELSHGSLAAPGDTVNSAPVPIKLGELVMRLHAAGPECRASSSDLLYMRLVTRMLEGNVCDPDGHREIRVARSFEINDGQHSSMRTGYQERSIVRTMASRTSTIAEVPQTVDERHDCDRDPGVLQVRRAMENAFNDIFIRYVNGYAPASREPVSDDKTHSH